MVASHSYVLKSNEAHLELFIDLGGRANHWNYSLKHIWFDKRKEKDSFIDNVVDC